MKYNLEGKVIILTGASTGIGNALMHQLLKKGSKVVGCATNINKIKKLEKKYKDNLLIIKCDLRRKQDIQTLVNTTLKRHKRIDMLVNNAGVGLLKELDDTSMKEVRNIFEINFFGLVDLTKMVLPIFEKQGYGYLVNVSSIAGKTPSIKNSIYTASKHAVIGLSDSIRRELRPKNIHVLVVNPTFVDTQFFVKSPQYLKEFGHHTKLVGFIKPEKMAKKTIKAIESKKWTLTYPFLADVYAKAHQLIPRVAEIFGK